MTDDIDKRIYKLAKANADLGKEIGQLGLKLDQLIKMIKDNNEYIMLRMELFHGK